MRKELDGTYSNSESGGLVVKARTPDLSVVNVELDRELLFIPYKDRVIELRPVTPKVTLINATPEMERTMALAGKICYSRSSAEEIWGKLSTEEIQKFLREKIIPTGHHSVIEHGLFTFAIENVSRAYSHQQVRHRIASYDQMSQRYCNPVADSVKTPVFKFVIPPNVRYSEERLTQYIGYIKSSVANYLESIDYGNKEEDARMVFPNAAATNLIMSMNARALYEMATKRTCALAQWEFDMVATQLVIEAYKHAPTVFEQAGPECCRTKCRERERSCGNPIKPVIFYQDDEIYPHDKLIFGMK